MEEIEFNNLVDNVATVLAEREDKTKELMVGIGQAACIVGAFYVVAKLVQNGRYRRELRRLHKAEKLKVVAETN